MHAEPDPPLLFHFFFLMFFCSLLCLRLLGSRLFGFGSYVLKFLRFGFWFLFRFYVKMFCAEDSFA